MQAAVQQKLPAQLHGLTGPVSAALKQVAIGAAPTLLANPNVRGAWVQANRAAHKELLKIINGGGPVVSTKAGVVTLNLHQLVSQLAATLGLQSQVGSVQSKLQGSTGAQARSLAQQKLGITLTAASGQLVIMRANQLKTAQTSRARSKAWRSCCQPWRSACSRPRSGLPADADVTRYEPRAGASWSSGCCCY